MNQCEPGCEQTTFKQMQSMMNIDINIQTYLRNTILLIAVIFLMCGTASAADIYVGSSETDKTIQGAINNATAGDTIIVRDGTYSENIDVNKTVTIRSENGAANCNVTAALSSDHVFDVTVDHVNISGFNVNGATGSSRSGIKVVSIGHRLSPPFVPKTLSIDMRI